MTDSPSRLSADNTTLLLGVVTIVSGVATGLFSDLRSLGTGHRSRGVCGVGHRHRPHPLGPESRILARWVTGVAFVLTAALLIYAFVTGPRLSSRTLVLAPNGLQSINAACPGAVDGSEV